MNRTIIKNVLAAAGALALLHAGRAVAQEPVVDGALRVVTPRTATTLVAPEMVATPIQLSPTVVPADQVPKLQRLASDLNRDGVIDELDLALLMNAVGPCPGGVACQGDLNADGVVDEHDLEAIMANIGLPAKDASQFEVVGTVLPAPAGLVPLLPAPALANGSRVLKLELTSANAMGLRVHLSHFTPSSGLELRVYDTVTKKVLGPYTAPHLGEDGKWWSPTIFGNTIGLEFTLPAGRPAPARMPEIDDVGYLFCDGTQCTFPPGGTFSCHNDVTCFPTWHDNEARAIAVVYFVPSGGSCARCTGALMNRGPGDFSPLFTLANHCISVQSEADSADLIWNFETATCNGAAPTDGDHNLGSLILKRRVLTDSTLLGLYEDPIGNYYVGSDPNGWASGDAATGLHHPRGTFTRISFGTSAGSTDGALFCDDAGSVSCSCNPPSNCIAVDTFDISYTSGTTEPGSSGSPIFDSTHRYRGSLTGGASGCAPITSRYGRYDRAYANFRYFINDGDVPAGTVFVNGGVAGDAGQNGSTERGTSANPFNSVYEATFQVRSQDTVTITPGSYNEHVTIWRPMTLTRSGASGAVTIGAP